MGKIVQNIQSRHNLSVVSKHADSNNIVSTRHILPIARAIAKYKANLQFKKFKKALIEVEQIEAGIIKPKSLQQLLNEL